MRQQRKKRGWITLPMVQRKMDGYRLTDRVAAPDAATVDKAPMHLPVQCNTKDGWTSLRVTVFSNQVLIYLKFSLYLYSTLSIVISI